MKAATMNPANTVSGDHEPLLFSKTVLGSPVPKESPNCFSWPSRPSFPGPFSIFSPFPKHDQGVLSILFPPPSPFPPDEVLQSQEGTYLWKPPPTTGISKCPHRLLGAASPFFTMRFLNRGNSVPFLPSPREKTGADLATNAGSARVQLCHLGHVTSPLYTSVFSSVRWKVIINLKGSTLVT